MKIYNYSKLFDCELLQSTFQYAPCIFLVHTFLMNIHNISSMINRFYLCFAIVFQDLSLKGIKINTWLFQRVIGPLRERIKLISLVRTVQELVNPDSESFSGLLIVCLGREQKGRWEWNS